MPPAWMARRMAVIFGSLASKDRRKAGAVANGMIFEAAIESNQREANS